MTIIMNDPLGDTKLMHDVVLDEVNNIVNFNFSEWYNFFPLGKVIGF